ncbi:hypothetical protein VPH35_009638 [Triticum aestivum]
MPKRTMGGRADTGAGAMAHEASKRWAKLHMEKPLPTGEESIRQQGDLDIVDHVQAPVQVLSDDVDSDPETQRIFRRQKLRQLDNGELEKAVRPRFGKGYGCPYCNKVMKGDLSSTINHAVGTSQGSTKNGYAFRVKHTTYADYLMRLL